MRSKPVFKRTDSHRYKKLKNTYRKGKGLHNKMGDHRKGHPTHPNIGYGNNKKEHGLIKGIEPIYVNTLRDLNSINKETQGVILSSTLGTRKKIGLIKKSEELKIRILNLDSKKFLEKVEEKKISKEKTQKEKESKKEEYKKEAEKRKKEKEEKESQKTKEEKEEEQEQVKRKVIEQG